MWSNLPSAKDLTWIDPQLCWHRLIAITLAILFAGFTPTCGRSQPGSIDDTRAPQPIPARPSAHETATLLIHAALRQAVWGKPVACKIRQRITLLDKQLVGSGVYAHAGQGSGQLKMQVRMVAGNQINSLDQISDGRVMSTQESIGTVSQRSRINLTRIREFLGPITSASLEDPVIAMYLAVGGQAELLRKLAQQYTWTHVQSGKLGETEVWWLTGELASEPPPVRAFAEIDQLLFSPNNSGLLPSTVRIALAKRDPLPYWLCQVEQARDESVDGAKSPTKLSFLLEFIEPQVLEQMSNDVFQSQPGSDTIVDETRRYLPPGPIITSLPNRTTR